MVDGCAVLDQNQPYGDLPFHIIVRTHDAALCYGRVGSDDFLHLTGREPVASDIDNVIGTTHNEHVPVIVNKAAVAGAVESRYRFQVGFAESLIVAPDCYHTAGWQWQFYSNLTLLAGGHLAAVHVHYLHVVARGGNGCRTWFGRH